MIDPTAPSPKPHRSAADLRLELNADASALCAVLDALSMGVVIVDPAGRLVACNRWEAARLGQSEADLLGRDYFRELVPALAREGADERFRDEVVHGGANFDMGVQLTAPPGERHLHFSFRSTDAERPWGIVLVEDRSELIREREQRERAERLASVGELAAGVAHQVNSPLASIKSFAQLLARDAANREQREALALIIDESTRVAGIVDHLLTYARQQGAGGREMIDLSEVVERVLSLQRYALDTADIQVRCDFDAALSRVMGESGALQQVVLNLIINAEQALINKPDERRLIIRTRESTEGVILSVIDNGSGIPREMLPTIFERFRSTRQDGTGLGLAISAAIVRDHSGQIWAESETGRGTAVFVRLPRATGAVSYAPAQEEHGPADDQPVRVLRVLIADDEPALRLAISLFLKRRGHSVTQASDAHEAYRLAGEQPFDVALIDARMPGDGLVLIERLEALPGLRGRTALMTGDIGRARTRQGIATGRPYLTKPFDMDEMVELIEKLGR